MLQNITVFSKFYQAIKQFILPIVIILILIPTIIRLRAVIAVATEQPLPAQNLAPDSPPPLLLTDEQEAYQLGLNMEVLEDAELSWTIADIASPEFAHRFQPNNAEVLRKGYTDSAYWVRLQVQNDSQQTEWWLEHSQANTQFVDLYIPQTDDVGFERYQTGLLRPFASRAIPTLSFVFPITIPPQSTQVLYLRFEHNRATQLPLTLWSPSEFVHKVQFKLWQLGFFIGSIMLLSFSIFFVWYRLRRPFLFYLSLLLGVVAMDPVINGGIGHQYLWPQLGPSLRFLDFFNGLIIFWAFLKTFTLALDTKHQYPRLHKALQGLMIMSIVVLIQLPFVAYRFVGQQLIFLFILAFLVSMVIVGQHFRHNIRSPIILRAGLLVFFLFILEGLGDVLYEANLLPSQSTNGNSTYSFIITIFMVSLIVAIITIRFINVQMEQRAAQRRLNESALALRNSNEELERRVLDRTRELSALYDVTSIANQALDLKTTMAQCLDRVVEVMQGNVGTMHLQDETGQVLRLATTQDLSLTLTEFDKLPISKVLSEKVIDQGETLILSDMVSNPSLIPTDDPIDLKSFVGNPIRASGSISGVLGIARRRGQPMFSVEEIALLGSIADQVGVVVESAKLREQAEQAAVIEERTRLARNLHDSVTQLMYSINLFAETGQKAYHQGDVARLNSSLVNLTESTQQAFKEMRLLVYELRPQALEQDNLVAALRNRLEMVEQRANIKTDFQVVNDIVLSDSVEEALYYIAEEALNNALKHAAATAVTIRLDAGVNQIELVISDNGRGFESDTLRHNGGLGLTSMRERVEKIGGNLAILSVPGAGTTVKAVLNRGGTNEQ